MGDVVIVGSDRYLHCLCVVRIGLAMNDLRHSIPRAVLVHFASVQRRVSSCNCCSGMTGSRCCAIVNSLSFSCEAVVSRYLPQVRKKGELLRIF